MATTLYGLLVGINGYPPEVGKLRGCLNDVDHFHDYLKGAWDNANLAIEVLKDADATRGNIINQFRSHLAKATKEDVVVFQYCGHGARWASAMAFREFFSDGKDEGLVCIDSRRPGGFDLADKELAVLLDELAKNNPHVALIIDSCHSGSITRDVDQMSGMVPRVTHEVNIERPLETYLYGHYADLIKQGKGLSIPTSRHIVLSACNRVQTAKEAPDRTGVFTSTLIDVLKKSGGDLTYADLFVRCRAAVRRRADNQDPQFETHGNFDSYSGFLGRKATQTEHRFRVYFDFGKWKVECGAIHGLPVDPEKPVGLNLYFENDRGKLAGRATTTQVGPQNSVLQLLDDFKSDPAVSYQGQIISLPSAPMLVYLKGEEDIKKALEDALDKDKSVNVMLTDIEQGSRYALAAEGGQLKLLQREMDHKLIKATEIVGDRLDVTASVMLPIFKHVAQWERTLSLQNPSTKLDPSCVDFVFVEKMDDGKDRVYPTKEVILDFAPTQEKWERGRIKVRNRSNQTLHFLLAYCSASYRISPLCNEPIQPGDQWITLWGDDQTKQYFMLSSGNQSFDYFKLIVSTEKVDDFLLAQRRLDPNELAVATREVPDDDERPKLVHRDQWFTKDLRFTLVRQVARVGTEDASLANGKIVIKSHPTVSAQLSLNAACSPARGVGEPPAFYKALERQGMQLLNFADTRGTNECILELTYIQNAASLKAHPLELELKVPLDENEGILPLVFDGEHYYLGGDPHKDENGNTHIRIGHIPEVADNQRSLMGSLKLYFVKTVLKREYVNKLRWVDYQHDGGVKYRDDGFADKVATAKNVLLLVHGIIGDTEGMAQGVKAVGLDQRFDLVLTYDYENLNTPIADTAKQLKTQLAGVGLREDDGKRLTLLVHSMGGLVSRWFIEREGGNQIVDHLVMCGTPNNGSPFGKIDEARQILNVLTGLAMNYLPVFLPFSGAVLFALNRSKRLTSSLEQMNPASAFIQTLNASPDPGIPYTILAGNIETYAEPSDRLVSKLVKRIGTSFPLEALFSNMPNDIAVSVDSILGIQSTRRFSPVQHNVACHHLNYFVSDAGQKALTAVAW